MVAPAGTTFALQLAEYGCGFSAPVRQSGEAMSRQRGGIEGDMPTHSSDRYCARGRLPVATTDTGRNRGIRRLSDGDRDSVLFSGTPALVGETSGTARCTISRD